METEIKDRIDELVEEVEALKLEGLPTQEKVERDLQYIDTICCGDDLDAHPYIQHYLRRIK